MYCALTARCCPCVIRAKDFPCSAKLSQRISGSSPSIHPFSHLEAGSKQDLRIQGHVVIDGLTPLLLLSAARQEIVPEPLQSLTP